MPEGLKVEELEDLELLDEIDVKLVADNLEDIYISDDRIKTANPLYPEGTPGEVQKTAQKESSDMVLEDLDEDDEDVFDADDEEVTLGFLAFLVGVMRIACVLLMGAIAATSIKTFWYEGKELGSFFKAIADKDPAYLTFAAAAVVINLILVLWVVRIFPKRKNGRFIWYDKGQGGFGFILILLTVCAAWPAIMVLEILPFFDDFWWSVPLKAVLEAINANHGFYLFCGMLGAALSFLRKNL